MKSACTMKSSLYPSPWEELDQFKCIEAKCRVDGDLAESIKRGASDRLGDLVP